MATAPDKVLQYLIAVHLTDSEPDFRSLIDLCGSPTLGPRELVIATVGVLMALGNVRWPVILKTVTSLKQLSEEELSETSVAIVNGDILVLPPAGDNPPTLLDMTTLRPYDGSPAPFVSTVYSTAAMWNKAKTV